MKIELNTEDVGTVGDYLDAMVVARLKSEKKMIEGWDGWLHKDDLKVNKKVLKAINVLLEYYGN
jgi:hypothetical protein